MPEFSEDVQQKFVLYQLLNQRLEQIKQHATIIQQKMVEVETTMFALGEMKSIKDTKEILIPLGSGFYTEGKSTPTTKILVDLGAGVLAKKSIEDANVFIEKKKKEIEDAVQMLQMEANAITGKLGEIVPELQKAAESQQAEGGAS